MVTVLDYTYVKLNLQQAAANVTQTSADKKTQLLGILKDF